MSSYRAIDPVVLLSGGNMTGTTVIDSKPMDIGHLQGAALSAVFTGTPVGKFQVMVSVDGVNYDDLGENIPDAAGTADVRIANLFWLAVKWVKLRYTNVSGSGTLTVTGMAKGA